MGKYFFGYKINNGFPFPQKWDASELPHMTVENAVPLTEHEWKYVSLRHLVVDYPFKEKRDASDLLT